MKPVSAALQAAQAGNGSRPGYLVEFHLGMVRRWSSLGAFAFAGHAWGAVDLQVQGLQVRPFEVSGALVFGNADDGIGTAVLSEGVKDRVVRIWAIDGAAPNTAVWLCDAVGSNAQVSTREVRIALRHRCEFVASPRTYVNQQAGFSHLIAAGTVLRINGIDLRLDRRP